MPTMETIFNVYCSECGSDLSKGIEIKVSKYEYTKDGIKVIIRPCEKCMQTKYEEGKEDYTDK